MAIRAGQLDRRVTLRRPSVTRDSFGQDVETFVDHATVYARFLRESGGDEFVVSDEHSSIQKAKFEIRFRAGIDPKWRVLYDGSEFEIEDIEEIGRREGLRLHCFVRGSRSGVF